MRFPGLVTLDAKLKKVNGQVAANHKSGTSYLCGDDP
jgi:hypothetical protein